MGNRIAFVNIVLRFGPTPGVEPTNSRPMDQPSTINCGTKPAAVKKALLKKKINSDKNNSRKSLLEKAQWTRFSIAYTLGQKKVHLSFEHNSGYGRHNFGRDDRNYDFIPTTSKREDNENEKVVKTSC